jgi:hypothetical protein
MKSRAACRVVVGAVLVAACAPASVELPIEPAATGSTAAPSPAPPADQVRPDPSEVRDAMTRIFRDAVVPDAGGRRFVAGDFNGDGSQDLAVVGKPSPKALSEINSAVANWILEDPLHPAEPSRSATDRRGEERPSATVEPGDMLLAVIHGYGPGGWRNPDARQTYLMVNAVGSEIAPRHLSDMLPASPGRTLQGDVITESLSGRAGFLYWTGARYAWHER